MATSPSAVALSLERNELGHWVCMVTGMAFRTASSIPFLEVVKIVADEIRAVRYKLLDNHEAANSLSSAVTNYSTIVTQTMKRINESTGNNGVLEDDEFRMFRVTSRSKDSGAISRTLAAPSLVL